MQLRNVYFILVDNYQFKWKSFSSHFQIMYEELYLSDSIWDN